jgi:hypothetical protein
MTSAAIGLRLHTGWLVAVAIHASSADLEVLVRQRIVLVADDDAVPRFVYHAAAERAPATADAFVAAARRAIDERVDAAVNGVLDALAERGGTAAACGIVGGGTHMPADANLAAILRAHPLIHAAEGALYETAVAGACERRGLVVTTMRERDLWAGAAEVAGISPDALRARIDGLRATVGPPWTADHKLATAAALVAGATPPAGRRGSRGGSAKR